MDHSMTELENSKDCRMSRIVESKPYERLAAFCDLMGTRIITTSRRRISLDIRLFPVARYGAKKQ